MLGTEVEVLMPELDARIHAGEKVVEGKLKGQWPTLRTVPDTRLTGGDRVGSLEVVANPGHTPGRVSGYAGPLGDRRRPVLTPRAGLDSAAVVDRLPQVRPRSPGALRRAAAPPAAEDTDLAAAATGVVDILVAVMPGYGLEGDEAIHAVRMVRSSPHGFLALEAEGGFARPISLDEAWQRLIALLDRGLASPA